MRKPFPEFYQLILNRFKLTPRETLFIDDNVRNAEAAEQIGIRTIIFKSPEQLKNELTQSGIL